MPDFGTRATEWGSDLIDRGRERQFKIAVL
jgi:hypothetical protein